MPVKCTLTLTNPSFSGIWKEERISCGVLAKLGESIFVVIKAGKRLGGADGIRTHYLLTASQTLSRLSYSPAWFKNITKQLEKLKLE